MSPNKVETAVQYFRKCSSDFLVIQFTSLLQLFYSTDLFRFSGEKKSANESCNPPNSSFKPTYLFSSQSLKYTSISPPYPSTYRKSNYASLFFFFSFFFFFFFFSYQTLNRPNSWMATMHSYIHNPLNIGMHLHTHTCTHTHTHKQTNKQNSLCIFSPSDTWIQRAHLQINLKKSLVWFVSVLCHCRLFNAKSCFIYVHVFVRESEWVCVCVWERERKRERFISK